MTFDGAGYVLAAGEGEAVWFLDTRMTVKAGGRDTGGAFTLLEWEAPEGFGPPRHVHRVEDEAFYLLAGELTVECAERRWTAGPGDFVFLPRAVPHRFVVSAGPVRGLQVTAPAGFERFIGELGRPPAGPGLPPPSAPDVPRVIEVSGRYGVDVVGPPLVLAEPGRAGPG